MDSDPGFSDTGHSWPTGDQGWVAVALVGAGQSCSRDAFEPAMRPYHVPDLWTSQPGLWVPKAFLVPVHPWQGIAVLGSLGRTYQVLC